MRKNIIGWTIVSVLGAVVGATSALVYVRCQRETKTACPGYLSHPPNLAGNIVASHCSGLPCTTPVQGEVQYTANSGETDRGDNGARCRVGRCAGPPFIFAKTW